MYLQQRMKVDISYFEWFLKKMATILINMS